MGGNVSGGNTDEYAMGSGCKKVLVHGKNGFSAVIFSCFVIILSSVKWFLLSLTLQIFLLICTQIHSKIKLSSLWNSSLETRRKICWMYGIQIWMVIGTLQRILLVIKVGLSSENIQFEMNKSLS